MKRIFTLLCLLSTLHVISQRQFILESTSPYRHPVSREKSDTIFTSAAYQPTLYRLPDFDDNQKIAGYLSGTDQLMSALFAVQDSGNYVDENAQEFKLNQNVSVTGAIYWFGAKNFVSGNPNSKVIFNLFRLDSVSLNVYGQIVPCPGTKVSSISVPLADIKAGATPDSGWNYVQFPYTPVNGNFAVGFDINQLDNKDTLGLYTSAIGKPSVKDLSWAKFDNIPWHTFKDSLNSFNADVDLAIFPIVEGYNGACLNFFPYLTTTDENCGKKGSITTNVTSGIPPYSYLWSNGDTTANLQNLNSGTYRLTVNDQSGCHSFAMAEIKLDCYSYISGTLFSDTDGNCQYTGTEPVYRSRYVVATQGGNQYYAYAENNGKYTIQVPNIGSYNVNLYNDWYNCTDNTACYNSGLSVNITTPGDTSANNDLGFTSAASYDLGLYPLWSNINPGFEVDYWIYYYSEPFNYNTGMRTVTFTYDSVLVYQRSSDPQPVHDAANHTLSWQVDSFASMYDFWQKPSLHSVFKTAPTLSLDYVVHNTFDLTPVEGDCNPQDNHLAFAQSVRGSHDPNEKEVSPADYLYEDDSLLTYTIHFQNNGTDSTHFIIVIDTLSTELNPATAHTIASSHPYSSFTVSGQGILTWTFDPLRLVDSLTNPEGSKGFVMFTIERRSNRSIGSVISNRAAIYFDYNEAVITNTVTDTIAVRTGIEEISLSTAQSLQLFPNPASSQLFISTKGFDAKSIAIYDMNGKLVTEINTVKSNLTKINIQSLSTAAYFVEAKGKDITLRKRFIKTEE